MVYQGQNNKYVKFLFLLGMCLLFSNASSLATPDMQPKSESVGTLGRAQERERFFYPNGDDFELTSYLKGEILGETLNFNNEVIAYKWPLQYQNLDPIDDYHVYFFVGFPLDYNPNKWLELNLDSLMKKFKESKGMEYLKIAFPSFYLGGYQQTTDKQVPCIDENRATKQGKSFSTNINLNRPFLFALIRNEDNKVMFKRYINDPLLNVGLCPFSTYSIISKTVPIQAEDSNVPNVALQEDEGTAFFRSKFIFNAMISESYVSEFSSVTKPFTVPHLLFRFNGKSTHVGGADVISIGAKTHAEAKSDRFVVFFVYPDPDTRTFPFPVERFSNFFEKTRSSQEQQISLTVPLFTAKMNSPKHGSFSVCIDATHGVPVPGFELRVNHSISLLRFTRPFQIFVHDHVANKIIALGEFVERSNELKCERS